MDYGLSDSSGTDDDLPPSHRSRFQGGVRAVGNGRSAAVVGSASMHRLHSDMETQIHNIEQEAYTSVLRAFKAQSDAITWDKETLITELRKELKISDEEHRELLSRVNSDDTIRRIREWRKTNGLQPSRPSSVQPAHDPTPSPTISASHKKQKTSQSVASLPMGAPSPAMQSIQSLPSSLRRGPPPGPRSKKPKSSMQLSSAGFSGRAQPANWGSSGAFSAHELSGAAGYDLIGKRVYTRWPEDNEFYEAFISDYKPEEGMHHLVYDRHAANETWEWVNLKEIAPEDLRWEDEDQGNLCRGGPPGPGRGSKKSMARSGGVVGAGRGRGTQKGQSRKDFPLVQNGIGKKASVDIEILHTDTLIKEVEKLFNTSHPGSMEIERAKKVLKEHEQALIDAIARLEDASDVESDRGWRKRPYDEMGGMLEGSDGSKMTRDGRVGSHEHLDDGGDI